MKAFKKNRERLDILKILKENFSPKKKIKYLSYGTIPCPSCSEQLEKNKLKKMFYVCNKCSHHLKMPAKDRLTTLLDNGEYIELNENIEGLNTLEYPGYLEKIEVQKEKSGTTEAVLTVRGKIEEKDLVCCVLESQFMMGSMGVAVGEKITRACEYATKEKLPLIIFSASGGARMQEGIFSLMQMAKTSGAIKKHQDANLLYISVLTHPTTGGVTASFASLGDINIAEPKALIGFAGPRVIEQTIRQKLPKGFQSSEYLLDCGFLDTIIHRREMRKTLSFLLRFHNESGEKC